jgi:hypothetical protein
MATANETDMSILWTDSTLQNRVEQALYKFCWSTLPSESITAANLVQHWTRVQFAKGVIFNLSNYKLPFTKMVASNQTVANDATAGGTLVGMTQQQLATAAAAVLDADIDNAIAAGFNAFVPGI